MKKGIVYFIQPSELVGTNRYKIGASNHPDFKRIKSYGVGTRIITVNECYRPFVLENKLIEKFNENFELLCKNEYFVGNELDMLKVFFDTVIEHKTKMVNINQNENKVDNKINAKTYIEKNKTNNINKSQISNKDIEKIMKSENTSGYPYFCDRCGYKTDRRSSFINHLIRKTECSPNLMNITREYILLKNKIYIDIETGKKINIIDNLNEDLSDSNTFNKKTYKYHCPYCNKKYTNKTTMYCHVRSECVAKSKVEEAKRLIFLEKFVS